MKLMNLWLSEKRCFTNAYHLCFALKGLGFSWFFCCFFFFEGDFCKHLGVRKGIIAEEVKNDVNICRYLEDHGCLVISSCPVVSKDA